MSPAGQRKHRRAVAPATDGVAEEDRPDIAEPAEAERKDPATSTKDGPGQNGSDQWWQDQRPPHWE